MMIVLSATSMHHLPSDEFTWRQANKHNLANRIFVTRLLHFVLLLRFADAFAAVGRRFPPVPFLVPIRQAS